MDAKDFFLFVYTDRISDVNYNTTYQMFSAIRTTLINTGLAPNSVPVVGKTMSFVYTPNSYTIYPLKQCKGSSSYVNDSCVNYTCLETGCLNCIFNQNFCSQCQSNYTINYQF